MKTILMLAAAAMLLAPAARAADLTLRDAFSRATPGTGPGIAYLTIQGGDTPDRLLSVTSPRAATVLLHSMSMQGGVMRMRAIDAVDIPPGATIALMPGAPLHLMIEGLTAPLKRGERLPLVLHFEKAGDKRIEALVGTPGQATMPADPQHAH